MKKSIRIIAVAVAAIILCMSFASCGLFGKTLNGKYESENGTVTYEFDGKNVKITAPKVSISGLFNGEKEVYEGTYKIDDDTITITLFDEDGDELDDDECSYDGTFDFEEKDNGDIIIGKTEYEIVD